MACRVLIATTGSLGDLYPMLALAVQLESLGVDVRVASSRRYRHLWQLPGQQFIEIGNAADYVEEIQYTHAMRGVQGRVHVSERLNYDNLDRHFDELDLAAEGADIIVAPVHVVPAHLVAEKRGIPFIACALSPTQVETSDAVGDELAAERAASMRWHDALTTLRRTRGLPRQILPHTSILRGATLILGLYPTFLQVQDRGAIDVQVVGYPSFHHLPESVVDPELASFCDESTSTFSFGSFVDACNPEYFAVESAAACRILGRKCLYLSRYLQRRDNPALRGPDVLVRDYIPHDAVFPLVGSVIHHGGMGTLACACRHRRPMIIVPFFLDQPYHAERMQRLVGSITLPAEHYNRSTLVDALRSVQLQGDSMASKLSALRPDCQDAAPRAAQIILSVRSSRARR